jgi:hypothetical protein
VACHICGTTWSGPPTPRREQPSERVVIATRGRRQERAGRGESQAAKRRSNTSLRLSGASGRTLGNRYQHLEAAYAENQEVQSDLSLIRARGVEIPAAVMRHADRLGGLIYGLLRAELRDAGK